MLSQPDPGSTASREAASTAEPGVPSPQPGGAPVGEAGVVGLPRRRDRSLDCRWAQPPCGVDGNGQGFGHVVGLRSYYVPRSSSPSSGPPARVAAAVALVFAVVPGEGEREPAVLQLLVAGLDRAARTACRRNSRRRNNTPTHPFRRQRARSLGARACERRYPDVEVELIIKQ